MVRDKHNRSFKSLRVSVTGDCNLACTYCDPSHRCEPKNTVELSGEELVKAVHLLVETLAIDKVRLTGGEPLISPKLEIILPEISRLPLKDLSLTTNGQLLAEKAVFLKCNNIRRLNISLDTLDPERYSIISGGGALQKTLDGIDKALEQRLRLKINMVPVRGINEDEILKMLDFCLDRNIELRYIELMQMGHLKHRNEYEKKLVAMPDIFDKIQQKYRFHETPVAPDSTARRYKIENIGYFGVVANDSAPFCRRCNRLRLSAEGFIYGCLSSEQRYDIKQALDIPASEAKLKLKKILEKAILTKQDFEFKGSSLLMRSVGG